MQFSRTTRLNNAAQKTYIYAQSGIITQLISRCKHLVVTGLRHNIRLIRQHKRSINQCKIYASGWYVITPSQSPSCSHSYSRFLATFRSVVLQVRSSSGIACLSVTHVAKSVSFKRNKVVNGGGDEALQRSLVWF